MPGFDGTGPRGMGPMTGGGRGFCNPYYAGARAPYMGAYPYGRPYGLGYAPSYAGYGYAPYTAYPYGAYGFGRGFGWGKGGLPRGWTYLDPGFMSYDLYGDYSYPWAYALYGMPQGPLNRNPYYGYPY